MEAIKLPFKFDYGKLYEELSSIANSFNPIYSVRIKRDALDGIHLIISAEEGVNNREGYSYCYTKELEQCAYLQTVLETFKCDKYMYRVHVLHAKGKIDLHTDIGKGLADRIVRLQIPVKTNNEVYFMADGERVSMENGECWLVDVTKLHEVENKSNEDRIKLIIDCDLNSWWETILKEYDINMQDYTGLKRHSLEELNSIKESLLHLGNGVEKDVLEKIETEIEERART